MDIEIWQVNSDEIIGIFGYGKEKILGGNIYYGIMIIKYVVRKGDLYIILWFQMERISILLKNVGRYVGELV